MTYHATSAYQDLGEAMENLRVREGGNVESPPTCLTQHSTVGYVVANGHTRWHSATAYQRHAQAMSTIHEWCERSGYQAAIWTALESKFAARSQYTQFNTETAIGYLEQLPPKSFNTAINYIRRAPKQIQTPVRAAVARKWPRPKWYEFLKNQHNNS